MTCDTLGLYARSVADLELLAGVFQLADDEPIPASPFPIKGSKIAFLKTHVWPKAGPGTKIAWEKAKDLLEREGASVEEIELPQDFEKISDWHARVLAGEGRSSFLGSKFCRDVILRPFTNDKIRLSLGEGEDASDASRSCRESHEAKSKSAIRSI
jgi:Asp-tRNA(Asn)/Glu-tRNA(Gln) amidotransferase A subunit family amidase